MLSTIIMNRFTLMCMRKLHSTASENVLLASVMQLGKPSRGYRAPIPQPWLLMKELAIWEPLGAVDRRQKLDEMNDKLSNGDVPRAFTGDSRLQLSGGELIAVGEFAQRLHEGRREFYEAGKKEILDGMGIKGVTEAKELMGMLGRRARMPCCAPRYQMKLPYLNPETLVCIPPAHLFLRGLVRSFISYAVGKLSGHSTPAESNTNEPLLIDRPGIARIKVCVSMSCVCLHYCMPLVRYTCGNTDAWRVQCEWERVEYPHGKGCKPEDPTHAVLDYKMEQLADLLWVGGIIAKQGSATFREAWRYLQPACVHYLFGFDSTHLEMVSAAESLRNYANLIEKLVAQDRVRCPTSYNAPTLHAAPFTDFSTVLNAGS
jgi:hypothetical protein